MVLPRVILSSMLPMFHEHALGGMNIASPRQKNIVFSQSVIRDAWAF